MLLKYLDIEKKETTAALLILMQNTKEGEFKRNGLNNKCPQLEKKRGRGLHQQIWDKQVGQGGLAQAAHFDESPCFPTGCVCNWKTKNSALDLLLKPPPD